MKVAILMILLLALIALPAFAAGPSPQIAVTFDDLPLATADKTSVDLQETINRSIVSALVMRHIPAIGFVNSSRLFADGKIDQKRLGILTIWLEAGLELGNHTADHLDLHRISAEEFERQVTEGEKGLGDLMGSRHLRLRYFRHPFLHTGRTAAIRNQIDRFLAGRGYTVAPVTIDNSDWIFARAFDHAVGSDDGALRRKIIATYVDYMVTKVAYYRTEGRALFHRETAQILLVHANALNGAAFGLLADRLLKAGARFVTLDRALEDREWTSSDQYFGPAGISWLDRWALTRHVRGDFFRDEPKCPQFILDLAGVEAE
jgi:peptidoglycan/xylan/chitin deacetylase (PgdA/CDA1 family)